MTMLNKIQVTLIITTGLLLLIPFIAMQFTDEVNWSLFDFIVAGTLLLTAGFLCEFSIRKVTRTSYRIAICLAILSMLVLLWVELAVGIFGSPIGGS